MQSSCAACAVAHRAQVGLSADATRAWMMGGALCTNPGVQWQLICWYMARTLCVKHHRHTVSTIQPSRSESTSCMKPSSRQVSTACMQQFNRSAAPVAPSPSHALALCALGHLEHAAVGAHMGPQVEALCILCDVALEAGCCGVFLHVSWHWELCQLVELLGHCTA